MAGGEKIIQGLREAVDHARQARAVSEQRSMRERLARALADEIYCNVGDKALHDWALPRARKGVDAILAEFRKPGGKARMAGGRSLLAGDVGPEVDAADAETLEAYASDFEQAWRAAIDAI